MDFQTLGVLLYRTREKKTLKFIGCVLGDLFAVDFVAR